MPSSRPTAPTSPQLLGFAEPVAEVPPVEDFLPPALPQPPPDEPVALAVPQPETTHEPEPAPEPEPEPRPTPILHAAPEPRAEPEPNSELEPPPDAVAGPVSILAHVPDLAEPAEPSPPLPRPQNLVGRLGRRLGDPPASRQPAPGTPPRFDQLPPEPPPARHAPQPAPKLTTPPPAPSTERRDERGGRPSLPRNRRVYRRALLPAEIEINGVPCTLIDVSIGGFAATGVPQLEPNTQVPVMIRLVIDGIEVGALLKARIIYVTQGRSAGRFVDLNPSQMAFLRYMVTWRGESVGAVGTTTLLDAIAGGPERGFAPGGTRSEYESKSRWWAGLIGKKVNPPR